MGIGTVGSNLLEQIKKQQPKLMSQNGLKLNVVGIASSKKCFLRVREIQLDNFRENLHSNGLEACSTRISQEVLNMNIFNSVFVDCTANQELLHCTKPCSKQYFGGSCQ